MSVNALDSSALEKFALGFERRLPSIETTPLAKILANLRKRFGTLGSAKVDQDKLDAAVRQALRDPNQLRSGQRLLLAFSLTQETGALRGKSIIEREAVLEPLLTLWERDARAGALKLSHWKGLFHSYMQAKAGPEQERLARLLKRTLEPAVHARKHRPAWLDGFYRHEQLLGSNPCAPYFDELMTSEAGLLKDLTENAGVSIPATSWFWQELKNKVVSQIARMGDARFRASMAVLIRFDKLIPLATGDLVKALIERYDVCSDRSRNQALMDFALNAWGSPQLESNLNWKACRKSARQMVCEWIAIEDLEKFYHLCKSEQDVDERRLEFWLGFKKQMAYTQILLGTGIRNSPDRGIQLFIKEREQQGRLGHLTGGDIWNNAMLMQIGGWLFVEFSKIGTACRAIRTADHELETGQRSYALPTLRHTGEGWWHTPNPGWDERFLNSLAEMGIIPDHGATIHTTRAPPPKRGSRRGTRVPPKNSGRATALVVVEQIRRLGLQPVDHRGKGGALWVYPPADTKRDALSALTRMGFRYVRHKGGWYLP